jgi:hypothetical protein
MAVPDQCGLLLKRKPAKLTRLQQEARIGLLFLSAWLIGFVLLKALPILAALIFSLTDFHMLTVPLEMIVALVLAAVSTSERLKYSFDGVAGGVIRVRYVGRVETPLFV